MVFLLMIYDVYPPETANPRAGRPSPGYGVTGADKNVGTVPMNISSELEKRKPEP